MTLDDPNATFAALYQAEHGRLLRYFRRRVGQDAALDLAQEVFTRLLRSGTLARIDNPGAYLSRIASNLLIDNARRAKREQTIIYPLDEARDAPAQPEQGLRLEAVDLRRIYWRALHAMSPRTRRIFLMQRLRGLTYREIAEQLGIGDKGVEYHMARALALCRRAIARGPSIRNRI